jgi:biopolymer transport protein ExbB
MKLASFLLAFALGAAPVIAQERSERDPGSPVLLAQANPPAAQRDHAITSINDKGAQQARPRAKDDDTFAIAGGARPKQEEGFILWQLIRNGGWAMYPLGFLSIVTVMLVLVYLATLRRGAIVTAHFMNTADVLLKKRDYLGLLAISSRHSEVVARIVQRTLDFATKNPSASYETVRDIAETEGGSQSASLQHRVTYLADIGVLSPMIGLLGTVSGIIRAFATLAKGDASISRDILLASGVSEALVATAAGLILGIISMGFYSLFRNRVHSLISDMEIATAHVMGLMATNFKGAKRESSRVAVEEEF